jgi:hypothetical protein
MKETSRGVQGVQEVREVREVREVQQRIRCEFLEMPGLRLTLNQARRLWLLDEKACEAVLGELVADNFLSKTRDGAFIRQDGR